MTEQPVPQRDPASGDSIDDALEASRVPEAPENAPAEAEGLGIDRTGERGADDSTAAEQGNRIQDEMTADDPVDETSVEDPLRDL